MNSKTTLYGVRMDKQQVIRQLPANMDLVSAQAALALYLELTPGIGVQDVAIWECIEDEHGVTNNYHFLPARLSDEEYQAISAEADRLAHADFTAADIIGA